MTDPGSRQRPLVRHAPLILACAVFLITAGHAFLTGEPLIAGLMAAIILAAAVPRLVERLAGTRIPTSLLAMYALLLLAAPWLGTTLDLYGAWPPWDTVVHGLSGIPISLGMCFVLGLAAHRHGTVLPGWLAAVVVFTGGVTVAVLWEVAEFVSDLTIGTQAQYDNLDTMQDMIAGATGSALVAVAVLLWRAHGWPSHVGRLLGEERPATTAACRPHPTSP